MLTPLYHRFWWAGYLAEKELLPALPAGDRPTAGAVPATRFLVPLEALLAPYGGEQANGFAFTGYAKFGH